MTENVFTTLSNSINELASLISSHLEKELAHVDKTGNESIILQIYELYKQRSRVESPRVFSDELAQSIIFYRVFQPKSSKNVEEFLFNMHGINFPDDIEHFIEDVKQSTAWSEISSTLGSNSAHDPIIQFYEGFLEAHDPKKRRKRGVYYTPEQVVSFITRSLQKLLTFGFQEPRGLSENHVKIWDPAVGTGAFLKSVYERVLDGDSSLEKESIKNHLLRNVSGNEIMLSPCLISRLRLRFLLESKGLLLEENNQIPVRFDNALDEGNKVHHYNKDEILVILGNPPYSVSSANKSTFIEDIMKDYKRNLSERNIQPLSDDYIKFIRYAQWRLAAYNRGIVGFVTNNSFIYKIIHRGMRESLLGYFNDIYILNLHGNANIGEKAPNGGKDENVFDIRVGICVILLVKDGSSSSHNIFYRDVYGTREDKLVFLENNDVMSVDFKKIHPRPPKNLFIDVDMTLEAEYLQFQSIKDIFKESIIGVKTHRDDFIVEFSRDGLEKKLRKLVDNTPDIEIKEKYNLKDDIESIKKYREYLRTNGIEEDKIIAYQYRLFDERTLYYSPSLITRDRKKVMKHMIGDNLALVTTRLLSSLGFSHCFISNKIGDIGMLSSRTSESAYFYPLYLYNDDPSEKEINFHENFLKHVNKQYPGENIEPLSIFAYIYGVLHLRAYKERYKELLKYDFPRIPLVKDVSSFKKIIDAGKRLIDLHLLNFKTNNSKIKLVGTGNYIVDKIQYDINSEMLHLNDKQVVEGIPPDVWSHKIGSYPVLKKWLKSRKNMELSPSDINNFIKIAISIDLTLEIIKELNQFPLIV
ncbi:MAG: type ISP restriction/modification enzyme [Candidatus Hodarchaeota archaeon]